MDCWIYPMMNILSLGSSNQNGWKWCYAKQPWWNIMQTWWIKQSHETDSRTWQLINQWLLCLTTLSFSYKCSSSVFSVAFFCVIYGLQWSLRRKTPCCKTDLSYVTAPCPHQIVFFVHFAPRYQTAPPRETTLWPQKGQSFIAGTTVPPIHVQLVILIMAGSTSSILYIKVLL